MDAMVAVPKMTIEELMAKLNEAGGDGAYIEWESFEWDHRRVVIDGYFDPHKLLAIVNGGTNE